MLRDEWLRTKRLTREQKVLGDIPVLYQQASARTGKTKVIAVYVKGLLKIISDSDLIIVTAWTKMTVISAVNMIMKQVPTLTKDEICFLQPIQRILHIPGRLTHNVITGCNLDYQKCLKRKNSRNVVDDEQIHFVKNYISCLYQGLKANDAEALGFALGGLTPKDCSRNSWYGWGPKCSHLSACDPCGSGWSRLCTRK